MDATTSSMDATTSSMDAATSKIDCLSRKTTIAEGQVEHIEEAITATVEGDQPPGDNNGDSDDDDDGGPCHPSDPGAHKAPGSAGYAHLAEFMTTTQYGIVRKYKDLSQLNLLYLQAEIHQLRLEWDAEVAADARATEGAKERRAWDYHWASMAMGAQRGLGGRRWELWGRLKSRLYEYQDAIHKHERTCNLPTPSNAQRSFLSEYIAYDYMNGGRAAMLSSELRGEDPEAYRQKWLEDLVIFGHGPEAHDWFARWVVMPILKAGHFWCFHKFKKPLHHKDLENGPVTDATDATDATDGEKPPKGRYSTDGPDTVPLYQYNITTYTILNRTLNAIFILLLPCAAILSLNAVHDTNKRVAMVCGFSLVWAVGMALCSNSSRIEVFAVSAAFMSVQLVFVGQQGAPGT